MEKALAEPQYVAGRLVECRLAVPRSDENFDRHASGKYKLFVNDLAMNVTSEDLKSHFKQYGAVKTAYVIIDPISKLSQCYGFVYYIEQKDAKFALKEEAISPYKGWNTVQFNPSIKDDKKMWDDHISNVNKERNDKNINPNENLGEYSKNNGQNVLCSGGKDYGNTEISLAEISEIECAEFEMNRHYEGQGLRKGLASAEIFNVDDQQNRENAQNYSYPEIKPENMQNITNDETINQDLYYYYEESPTPGQEYQHQNYYDQGMYNNDYSHQFEPKSQQKSQQNPRFQQTQYEQTQYDQAQYDQQRYDQQRFDQQRFEQQKYEQQEYEKQKYEQQKYEQQKYDQQRYDQQVCDQQNYAQDFYHQQRSNPQEYQKDNFNQDMHAQSQPQNFNQNDLQYPNGYNDMSNDVYYGEPTRKNYQTNIRCQLEENTYQKKTSDGYVRQKDTFYQAWVSKQNNNSENHVNAFDIRD